MNSRVFSITVSTIKSMNSNGQAPKQQKSKDPSKKKSIKKSVDRRIQKEVHKAAKVVQTATQSRTAVRSAGVPRPILLKWAKGLSKPFESRGHVSPVCFNPAPSILNTTATTTITLSDFSVLPTSTTQWVVFPGHGAAIPNVQGVATTPVSVGTSMDAVAFHQVSFVQATNNAVVGPIDLIASNGTDRFDASCVHVRSGLSVGGATNLAAGGAMAVYDEKLPYSFGGNMSDAAHVRYQLVSCGMRIYNQTPEISRGGHVVTCQLANSSGIRGADGVGATGQRFLEHNPSFKVHGVCDGVGLEIAWTPRLQDLAYWHPVVPASAAVGNQCNVQTNLDAAGMAVWFNNPTSSAQTYAVQMIFNWQISGNYLASISREAVNEPALKPQVEQTVTHLLNTASTAAHAVQVATAATTSATENLGISAKLQKQGYDGMSDLGHTIGSKLLSAGFKAVKNML